MACCVVGSLLMLLVAAVSRGIRRHLLRQLPEEPEAWRLQ